MDVPHYLKGLAAICGIFIMSPLRGQEAPYLLPRVEIEGFRVANLEPAFGLSMPVTGLRYEPQVDVQARNLAESQGDISIRGGTFENTGFILGAATLFDPQTGHYFAEIPAPAEMLQAPAVLTGLDNALYGFNSNVGSIQYRWGEIYNRNEASAFFGSHGLNRQSFYAGYDQPYREHNLAADVSVARSESNGLRSNGDHQFQRYAGRLQWRTAQTQTDLFAGYQSKFFGWPYLYAPRELHQALTSFGASGSGAETENLQTRLFLLNHQMQYGNESYVEFTGYYRKHTDDYELDRFVPGIFNPFEHESAVWSAGLAGRHILNDVWSVRYAGQALTDRLDSSNLSFAPFSGVAVDGFSRTGREYLKISVVPEWQGHQVTVRAGATIDTSSEDRTAASPLVAVAWQSNQLPASVYLQYAETTQVPGYTALAANPNSGLFRGNALQGREETRNTELGIRWEEANWQLRGAVFFRQDRDLVDWTLTSDVPSASRTANAVDIDTVGFELIGGWQTQKIDLLAGYTYLGKDEDYRNAAVTGSFYALNYAQHRLTLSMRARLTDRVELRLDNEFRVQQENVLRDGARRPVLSTLSVAWDVVGLEGLTLEAIVENLWDVDYEEVPSVPGTPIHAAVGASYRF